jgi:hypothetical protein
VSPVKRPSSVAGLRRGVASPATAAAVPAAPVPADPPRRPRPEKPVRFTLDLDPAHHRFLREYADRAEARASEVMRALLDELAVDEDLAARVRDRIWQAR